MGDARAKMGTPGSDAQGAMMGSDGGGGRVLYKAVVVEVINDRSYWTDVNLAKKFGREIMFPDDDPYASFRVSNPQFLRAAPRNTCVVRVISQGFDKQQPPIVSYPFFPPHISMPVKPGEQVWLMTESPSTIGELPMWLCRVPEPLQVDDINFTHGDRKLSTVTQLTTSERLEAGDDSGDNALPGFPNGTGTSASETSLKPTLGNNEETPFEEQENSYDVLVKDSLAYTENITLEQVPRFTKRPGDLVLQGSNNTAIILGEDRGWKPYEDPQSGDYSNAFEGYKDMPGFKGTIDIVAGRGRFFADELTSETTKSSKADPPVNTQARLVENERKDGDGWVEVDKNPSVNEMEINPPEGDPDFVRDCSRVYVSMKTDGDYNFGSSRESFETGMPTGFEAVIEDVDAAPYVVVKSDEVRIIARKDSDNDVNGSIKIVKQGQADDDLAAIVMLPDGTIQISGSKIYLGRPPHDGGAGYGPGESESQPYVKYQELEDIWFAFMDDLSAYLETVLTHTTPGHGSPSPQIIEAATAFKDEVDGTHRNAITRVPSERIFGE